MNDGCLDRTLKNDSDLSSSKSRSGIPGRVAQTKFCSVKLQEHLGKAEQPSLKGRWDHACLY